MTGEAVRGVISAGTRRDALAALTQRSLFPVQVADAKRTAGAWLKSLLPKRRIKAEILAANLSQLADLLHNGVSLLGALDVLLAQATHPGWAAVLSDVRTRVVEGSSLDEALARHPDVFNELTISMVRAGSEGAFLEDALKRTADFMELQEELKGRVTGAMAYPTFLAVAGFVVTVVLVVFFVPKFAELFSQLEQQGGLPAATVVLLWLSDFLGHYGVVVAGALVAAGVWLRTRARTPRGRLLVDRVKLKLPVIGGIFLSTATSRFCRVLGTLLRNGVGLLRALEISRDSTGNLVLARAIGDSAANVTSGDTLSKPLSACGLFPAPVMAMIRVAEESNNLESVLINVADGIDKKTQRQLDIMVRLVEPTMLMVMGTVIMFVLVALLMPVFDMSATMK
jgi:type II secretory pathway component PulF